MFPEGTEVGIVEAASAPVNKSGTGTIASQFADVVDRGTFPSMCIWIRLQHRLWYCLFRWAAIRTNWQAWQEWCPLSSNRFSTYDAEWDAGRWEVGVIQWSFRLLPSTASEVSIYYIILYTYPCHLLTPSCLLYYSFDFETDQNRKGIQDSIGFMEGKCCACVLSIPVPFWCAYHMTYMNIQMSIIQWCANYEYSLVHIWYIY